MKKTDVKIVLLSAVGVVVAGLVMSQFRDAPVVSDARGGFVG